MLAEAGQAPAVIGTINYRFGQDCHVAPHTTPEAVELLAERLGEVAAKTKGTGERLAVMTALNLAHELLAQKYPSSGIDTRELRRKISAMEVRLDEAMAEQEKLF